MPFSLTTPVYQSPSGLNAGETLTAAEWLAVANDVAFFRSAPWAVALQTGNSSSLAVNSTQTLFGGTGSGTYSLTTNTTTSTFSLSSGVFTVPVAGMYHISACVGVGTTNLSHWRAQLQGLVSGTAVWNFPGNTVNGVSGGTNDFSVLSVTVPMGTGGPLGGATSFSLQVQNTNASGAAITPLGQSTLVALQTTWLTVTYLGNGFGNF